PSSSHTAGAVRMGLAARALLGAEPVRAEIGLHGSFARTYRGHGTDKALIAGILGLAPDDERIRFSPALARQAGLAVQIRETELDGAHPNTALLTLRGAGGETVSVQAASVGGGSILVSRVNGMEVQFSGQYTTLIVLHKDAPGTIAAVTELLAAAGVNICNFRLARRQKGGAAVMTIETDGSFGQELSGAIGRLPNVLSSTLLPRM
uniref:L-serine ammonia-lyase, iron-sulfur-dependent subunit beta n=1 Tax=Allofournierella sp. TaxID=1940256 RepID=UPI003AB6719E